MASMNLGNSLASGSTETGVVAHLAGAVPTTRGLACSMQPCPYCELGVPHNMNLEAIQHQWYLIHSNHWEMQRECVVAYHKKLLAFQNIMVLHGKLAQPPPPFDGHATGGPSSGVGPETATPAPQRAPEQPTEAAASPTRVPEEPTFYKRGGVYYESYFHFASRRGFVWQYEGGKKKKWTEYDDPVQEDIEQAFQDNNRGTYDLFFQEWGYTLDFSNMSQKSLDTGTLRAIRRVERQAYLESTQPDAA